MSPAPPHGPPSQGSARALHHWSTCMLLALALWLVGCAQPQPTPTSAQRTLWTGRMALQVQEQASQSFSASFELSGSAQQGQLVLLNFLGGTVARLQWRTGHAEVTTGQDTRTSESLDALLQNVLGTEIPVAALFSWLQGTQVAAVGWQADLSAIADGRLVAQRHTPEPQATLRIVLTH